MDDDLELPPLSEVVKFQNQDFEKIRAHCSQENVIWEDPNFNPDIGDFVWKRPWQIADNPFLLEERATYDVRQGLINDGHTVAAMQALTTRRSLLNWVVPKDQGCTQSDYGIEHFRIWQLGTWYDICVDNRLPTKDDSLVYTHSKREEEFWCALLEKACAKLYGSYEALEVGSNADVMVEFSGGISESICLDNPLDSLDDILLKAYKNKLLLCANMKKHVVNVHSSKKQLRDNHDYSITRVRYVKTRMYNLLLVRLRSPCGFHKWTGPWSETSFEWNSISDETKAEIGLTVHTDGEFWMSVLSFKEQFSTLNICHISPNTVLNIDGRLGPSRAWRANSFRGDWVRGVSAGGTKLKTVHRNPQYRITLAGSDENDKEGLCTIVISLFQKNKTRQKGWTAGIKLFKLQGPKTMPSHLTPEFFSDNPNHIVWGFQVNRREMVCRQKLLPGEYCVIPCTKNRDEEGKFLLRVYTESGVVEEIDHRISLTIADISADQLAVIRDVPYAEENKTDEDIVKLFSEVSGKDMTIDWAGLKKILEHGESNHPRFSLARVSNYFASTINSFNGIFFPTPTQSVNSDAGKMTFSKELCRTLIAFTDDERSGRIGYNEFDNLWSQICKWKIVYRLCSKRKGYMESAELRESLEKVGVTINSRVLSVLIRKFADEQNRLACDDFLMCVVTLHMNMDRFRELDHEDTGQAVVSLRDWVTKTLFL